MKFFSNQSISNFLFLLLCILISNLWATLSLSQTPKTDRAIHGFKAAFTPFITEGLEISRSYQNRRAADFKSKPTTGFEGKFQYFRVLKKKFQLASGILVGVYPMYFETYFDSSFTEINQEFYNYFIDRRTAIYVGFNFNADYLHKINEKQFFSLGCGVSYVLFVPQFYSYNMRIHDGSQIHHVFSAKANMNVPEEGFLAPELSIGYHQKIGRRFTPYLLAKGVYSSNRPIVGRSFSIFGKSETLEGSFKKQFAHVGIEVGLRYSL